MESSSTLNRPTNACMPNNAFTTKTSWLWGFMLLTALIFSGVAVGQTTLFQENFEAATGSENFAGPYLGWQSAQFTQQTNNNYWWILDDSRCNVISGNYSMAVSRNNPATTGILPQYNTNRRANTLGYYTTPIDATNYTNITLDFNWICVGEVGDDYGNVMYSYDGATWIYLPGDYVGQNTVQNVVNLDLSDVNQEVFYIGFSWINNQNGGTSPGFIVDDIVIRGDLLTPCTNPTQPTALVLNATDNTVNGSFTAPTPAADNYLVIRNTTGTAPTIADGNTYIIGQNLGGTNVVVDTDNNNTFSATGLTPNTTYYFFVYSYNNIACSGGPNYNTVTPLTGNITTLPVSYCFPSSNNGSIYINNVEFLGSLQDVSNNNTGYGTIPATPGYQNFTTLTPKSTQAKGEGINVYVEDNFIGGRIKAWIDWNKDNDFNDTGELVYDSTILINTTTFGFVIPTIIPGTATPLPVGDYRIRIRNGISFRNNGTTNVFNFDACQAFNSTLNNNHQYGEAEDYLFTVIERCPAVITSVTDGETCGAGNVTLEVTGTGTEYRWYTAETGGTLFATTPTGILNTPLASTTTFYVTAFDNCESPVRVPVTGKVNPLPSISFTPNNLVVCGENEIIEVNASGDVDEVYLINEDFESGGLGVFTRNLISGNANSQWTNRTSTYIPNSAAWKPAISSGFGTNRFVLSNSDYAAINENELISPIINTTDFQNLTLSFKMYYSHYRADNTETTTDYVALEISTNGGGAWTPITPNYVADVGYGTKFATQTFDLTALYINQPTLRIRFRFYGAYKDGVAIDDIKVFGSRPLNSDFDWNINADMFSNAAATTPFVYNVSTPVSTIYVRPSLIQLENATFTIVAESISDSGCAVTGNINVTNNTKIWNGSTANWNVAGNWLPTGIPDPDNCVIIRDNGTSDPTIGPPFPPNPGFAKNLTILNDGFLELQTDTNLTVTDWINVQPNGIFSLRNSASLVQVLDITTRPNTGNIHVQRAPKSNFGAVGNLNYVYWSSPVENFNLGQISPNTSASLLWQWAPTVAGNGPGNHGDWQNASGAMIEGKGYIVRGLSGTPTVIPSTTVPVSNNTALFTGIPNNGEILVPISRGTWSVGDGDYTGNGNTATHQDDNWNLLGNPYPSSISANNFVTMNPNISGTIYIWPHATLPNTGNDDPFYDDFVSNYSNSYIEHNPTGAIPPAVTDVYIASGQSFMTLMMDSSVSTNETVTFNNSLREGSQPNTNFFRQNENSSDLTLERHRIWLDLVTSNNQAHTLLVGYVSNATNDLDRLYDGYNFLDGSTSFYSLIEESTFSIQGRALPFLQEDTVPLGFKVSLNDIYKIGINTLDGLFVDDSQNIYLEDLFTNTIHDLRASPYMFSSQSGTFNNRFILRYTNETLGVNDPEFNSGLNIISYNNEIKVTSTNNPINTIEVYDILGRTIVTYKDVNVSEFKFNLSNISNGTFIVKATLYNGQQKVKKIVH